MNNKKSIVLAILSVSILLLVGRHFIVGMFPCIYGSLVVNEKTNQCIVVERMNCTTPGKLIYPIGWKEIKSPKEIKSLEMADAHRRHICSNYITGRVIYTKDLIDPFLVLVMLICLIYLMVDKLSRFKKQIKTN